MAAQQRTEKEDTDFKVPPESSSSSSSSSSLNSLLLCSNNDCGLTGSPSTNNMCQKCFDQSSPSPSPSATSSVDDDHLHLVEAPRSSPSPPHPRRKPAPASPTPLFRREVNRCSGCSRKVGLTGFRCRCGELFCAEHRYSDRHDCSYDYKAAGREAISRENPVIKAAKIVRV